MKKRIYHKNGNKTDKKVIYNLQIVLKFLINNLRKNGILKIAQNTIVDIKF